MTLCEPLDYGPFVTAMKRAWLVLTDSGGVKRRPPALGKPVLVLRNETERPEAVQEGVVELVGTERRRIVGRVAALLDDEAAYHRMAKGSSPMGTARRRSASSNIWRNGVIGGESGLCSAGALLQFHPTGAPLRGLLQQR